MAAQRDYYQVLGVAETATTDEIKKAFRRLAKQHHPDRNPNNPQAAERFKEINEAHDVLSDADKRRKYDQLRRYGAYAGAARPSEGAGGAIDFDLSDLSSFGGLGDIFSSIFGRRGGGGGAGGSLREEEEEIETTVSIPFRLPGTGARRHRRRDRRRAGPVFPARGRRPRRHGCGADQPRAGDARHQDQGADAGREARGAQGAARHATRPAIPHRGAGDREERSPRRPVRGDPRRGPRAADAGAGSRGEGVRGAGGDEVLGQPQSHRQRARRARGRELRRLEDARVDVCTRDGTEPELREELCGRLGEQVHGARAATTGESERGGGERLPQTPG